MTIFSLSYYFLILAVSLFALGKSAEYLVTPVTRLGFILRLSQFITGFILLGITTSIPEISVAVNSIANSTPELSLGNLLGANIVLMTLVAGLTAIVAHGIILKHEFRQPLRIAQIAILIFSPIIVLIDSHLSRLDGLFLLGLYAGYLA